MHVCLGFSYVPLLPRAVAVTTNYRRATWYQGSDILKPIVTDAVLVRNRYLVPATEYHTVEQLRDASYCTSLVDDLLVVGRLVGHGER